MNPLLVDSLIKSTLTIISHFYSKDANVNKSLKYVKSILDMISLYNNSFVLQLSNIFKINYRLTSNART